jgi:hypothetical protein
MSKWAKTRISNGVRNLIATTSCVSLAAVGIGLIANVDRLHASNAERSGTLANATTKAKLLTNFGNSHITLASVLAAKLQQTRMKAAII